MKKGSILLFIVLFFPWLAFASLPGRDSTDVEIPDSVLNLDANLDSMLNLWYAGHYQTIENLSEIDTVFADSLVSSLPDSVIISRLAQIPSVVPLTYNHIVRRYIEMYSRKRKELMGVMLGLSEYYFPIFEQILDYYQLPIELKYMTVIESALNPRAYSRARAVGLWQFMYGTGKKYGLTINSLVDERMDPFKSTVAACRFMSDLYNIFKDWTLVIAAYNCGPANVNKAIRRAGGKTNYWDIYYYLPRETRGYVPAFIAATYVMNYAREHNITPVKPDLPLPLDTIMVNRPLHLGQIAEVLNIPIKAVRDLNPQYFRDIVPAYEKPFPLTLPMAETYRFIDAEDSIYIYKDSVFFNAKLVQSPASGIRGYIPGPPDNSATVHYRVRSGDNLGSIAMRYNVRVSDLMYWNGLHNSRIRAGQRLVIYMSKKKASHYASSGKNVSAQSGLGTVVRQGDFIYYTVKQGDTLWDIAKLYPGVSTDDILQWNNLSEPSRLKPGQVIRIKPRG